MTLSVTMLLSIVLPILATTILFALLLSVFLLFAPRPRAETVTQGPLPATVALSRS
jgi:hypothetical protein